MDENTLRDIESDGFPPFSTETEYGRSYRNQVAIGCWLAAGMVLALGAWSVFDRVQAGGNWTEGLSGLFILSGIAVGILLIPRLYPRGTWELDDTQLRFVPLRGKPVELAYADVDRASWDSNGVAVKGCGVKIRIPWGLIDPEVRDAAKRFVEAKLGSSFDLRPRDTSLLVWSVIAAIGAGLVAYELAWISFQVLMPLVLLVASVGCVLKFRLDPIWRRRGRDC